MGVRFRHSEDDLSVDQQLTCACATHRSILLSLLQYKELGMGVRLRHSEDDLSVHLVFCVGKADYLLQFGRFFPVFSSLSFLNLRFIPRKIPH